MVYFMKSRRFLKIKEEYLWEPLGEVACIALLVVLSFILQAHINIPWSIVIPLIALAFWVASEKKAKTTNKYSYIKTLL